jgi:hypothetical protein
MNAYLNFMDSVMRFWMNAWTEALATCANASVQAPKSAKRLWDIKKAVPVFDIAAPLFDLHSLYEGGRWDHILTAPEQIHVVLNTTFHFGDIAGDAERRPGSVAERDGDRPNRGLSAPAPPRPDAAPPASSAEGGTAAAIPEAAAAAHSTA